MDTEDSLDDNVASVTERIKSGERVSYALPDEDGFICVFPIDNGWAVQYGSFPAVEFDSLDDAAKRFVEMVDEFEIYLLAGRYI